MKTLEFILNEDSRIGILSRNSPLLLKIIYLFLCSFIAAILLYHFAFPFLHYFELNTSFKLEITEVTSQIFVQGAVIFFVNKNKIMDYLMWMVTISLLGGALFIPMIVLQQFIGAFHPWLLVGYFFCVVLTMFILHLKSCKKLGIGYAMSISWVLYRFVILYFTFNL